MESRRLHRPQTVVIIVVMGASGAGKTIVGQTLARALGWPFIDADELHSPANIDKMRKGVGLSHIDRMPWLGAVRERIDVAEREAQSTVIACSALTHEYRAMLSADTDQVRFVYLQASPALLEERLRHRRGHFAGPSLLTTQLATLEEPDTTALTLDAAQSPDALVLAIRSAWQL